MIIFTENKENPATQKIEVSTPFLFKIYQKILLAFCKRIVHLLGKKKVGKREWKIFDSSGETKYCICTRETKKMHSNGQNEGNFGQISTKKQLENTIPQAFKKWKQIVCRFLQANSKKKYRLSAK